MNYYYFDPFKRQYYFSENYQQYKVFDGFYQPYTLKGWLLWQLWDGLSAFRKLFVCDEPQQILPIDNLKPYLPQNAVMAYNRGTIGVEQKFSILGVDIDTNEEFFIKYAETVRSRVNVENEGEILKQLAHLNFVPQLQKHINHESFTFIQTDVLKGKRLTKQKVEAQLLDVLYRIGKQRVDTKRNYSTELKSSFAHGDFCPWNMLDDNGTLKVYDWEMAGIYPLGYDLFTYIFQTAFLLTPNKSIETLLTNRKITLFSYFSTLNILDWKSYLLEFAKLKVELETKKNDNKLLFRYSRLVDFALKYNN